MSESATEKTFEINGHRIVALEYNPQIDSIPIICVHGITVSVGFWQYCQTPIINEQFRWYSLSLPGHYPADFPANLTDISAQMVADVLAEAIRELCGDQKPWLVGHSTGGFASLAVASHYPDLVAGVMSLSGFAHGKWTGGLGMMQPVARYLPPLYKFWYGVNQRYLAINRPLWRIYAKDAGAMYHNLTPQVIEPLHSSFAKLNLDHMVKYFAQMPDIDITDKLSNITVPTLALTGTHDPIVPPKQAEVIAQHVPDSTLKTIDGSGHLPMFERPEAYHQCITEWVNQEIATPSS